MSSSQQVFDLNDLEDDPLELTSNFDLESLTGNHLDSENGSLTNSIYENKNTLTLESILNEDDDIETDELVKSFQASIKLKEPDNELKHLDQSQINPQNQYTSLIEKNGIVCKQACLKQISTQLVNAIERSDSGLPTALAVAKLIAVGTSRGLILLFDALQALKLYITTEHKDAISALSFNNKCDRLLVGNATGLIFMFDATNGKCLRTISDAHPAGNAILNLKFTDDSKLACFSDSGGSVFMLEFKRTMGVRGANSICLFSGSRGEVCQIEPLKFEKFSETLIDKMAVNNSATVKKNLNGIQNLFNKYTLLAMASFTKVFIVTLKPKLTVLFTYPLTGNMKYLPIINWQLVIIQRSSLVNKNNQKIMQPKRFVSPILACARESTILFFQVDYYQNENEVDGQEKSDDSSIDLKFVQLQKSEFNFKIINFCWLNAKTLAILDDSEKVHIYDIRSNTELQVLANLSSIKLVYSSTFFKSLATGGYVSKALAYAGENACYSTIQSYLGQFFMLGSRSVEIFSLQNWSTRIDDFINDNSLDLALDLALSMFKGEAKALIGLPMNTVQRKEKIVDKIIDVLYLYVNRAMNQDCPKSGPQNVLEKHYERSSSKFVRVCIEIDRQDILFDNLYSLITCDALFEGYFLESLEEYILNKRLNSIPPVALQNFIEHYMRNEKLIDNLEKCILNFKIESLNLHNLIQSCRKNRLLDAFIHLYNALGDFITPIEEIIKMIKVPLMFLTSDTASICLKNPEVNKDIIKYFNKLFVYVHVCLCGRLYPYGLPMSDETKSDRLRIDTFNFLIEKRNPLIDKLLLEELEANDTSSPMRKNLSDLIDLQCNLGNYPILRIFLNYNTLDFLNVLSMSFNEPCFEAVIGIEKKQQLIDILIQIGLNSSGFNYLLAGHLFTFLARLIGNENNNIRVDDMIFSQVIEYLCSTEDNDRIEEREQTLVGLLNSKSAKTIERFSTDRLLALSLKAKFYQACEILYEQRCEYCEIIDCYLNAESSTERQNKIFNVVRGILKHIIYTDKPERISERTGSFYRVKRSDSHVESRDVQFKDLQKKLIRYETLKQMISINPCECIFLLWIEMNTDLKFLINTIKNFSAVDRDNIIMNNDSNYMDNMVNSTESLNEVRGKEPMSQELLFRFMKGLFDLAELLKPDRKYIHYMSQFNAEYCELYVDLICVYEPDKILYFLQTTLSDYTYRIDECLRICRKRKVWDGAAYLLEKSGQIEAAFSLNSEKLVTLIRELLTKLLSLQDSELNASKSTIDATLVSIVQLCQRNSQSLTEPIKDKIWFTLFDEVIKPIQTVQFVKTDLEKVTVKEQNLIDDRIRLEETRLFFKQLGSYIIKSMMGYLNLTTIIDKIVCDPMYGASNFGDIKDLMIKMVEMCTYEQVLLTKTANLVCHDVYSKLVTYRKYSSKSFSSLINFCNFCMKPFQPSFNKSCTIKSLTDSTVSPDTSKQEDMSVFEQNEPSICIYHCGHSFHEACLEMNETITKDSCPICSSKQTLFKREKHESPVRNSHKKHITQEPVDNLNQQLPSYCNKNITFTSGQVSALSAIRSRNYDSLNSSANFYVFPSKSAILNIEKQSKLKLSPANMSKFIDATYT